MIISRNTQIEFDEFEKLVTNTVAFLNQDASERPAYYLQRDGRKLELDVKNAMDIVAKGTEFEDTIELIGGQKFPDIVAKRIYGVEVKSTTQNHWNTIGNSVLESTRVENVEFVYLLFGKLAEPIEFRAKKYQDCIPEVIVTHYPRYKIDMELSPGETIFDKMGTDYNVLRLMDDPIKPISTYYKNQLKPGDSLWWIDSSIESVEKPVHLSIRWFRNLDTETKEELTVFALTRFPEIFRSGNHTKYERLSLYLLQHHSIITSNIRDSFSARGKVTINTKEQIYDNIPRVYKHVQTYHLQIIQALDTFPLDQVEHFWGVSYIQDRSILLQWIDVVSNQTESEKLRELLLDIFNQTENE